MEEAGTPSQEQKHHTYFSCAITLSPSSLNEHWRGWELMGVLCYTISVITTAQQLLQHHKVIAMIKQCFTCRVINGWKHFHVAWWGPCCLWTTCTQSLPDQSITETTEGPIMGWVVLQSQLCPITEVMLTVAPDRWIQQMLHYIYIA